MIKQMAVIGMTFVSLLAFVGCGSSPTSQFVKDQKGFTDAIQQWLKDNPIPKQQESDAPAVKNAIAQINADFIAYQKTNPETSTVMYQDMDSVNQDLNVLWSHMASESDLYLVEDFKDDMNAYNRDVQALYEVSGINQKS